MKLTIDTTSRGNEIVARDEDGNILATRSTTCNPSALHQLVADAESLGEIDWESSCVAKPEWARVTKRSELKGHENMKTPLDALKHHCTGAVERGEAIAGIPSPRTINKVTTYGGDYLKMEAKAMARREHGKLMSWDIRVSANGASLGVMVARRDGTVEYFTQTL